MPRPPSDSEMVKATVPAALAIDLNRIAKGLGIKRAQVIRIALSEYRDRNQHIVDRARKQEESPS